MSGKNPPVSELPRVAKGASFNFLGAISRSLLGFIFIYALARILTAEQMGLFSLGANIVMFITIIGIAGLDAGLRRFISISHINHDANSAWSYFLTALFIAIPLNLLLAGMLFLLSDYLAHDVFQKPDLANITRFLIPYLFFYVAAELLLAVTQGYKHMKYWVLCLDVVNNLLRIVFVVGLSFVGLTLYGAIFGYVLSIFFSSWLAYLFFRKVMPSDIPHNFSYKFHSLASFSFPVSLARLVNSGTGILETILLGYFVISKEIAIYNVALKIAVVGSIVLASFNTVFGPLISQFYAQNRLDELQKLFTVVTRWTFSLSLPVFMLVAWYAAPIAALFGQEYVSGANVIVVLCLGQLVNAVTGPSGNLLLMSGHTYTNLWINVLGLVVAVALIVVLTPSYGIEGCAVAVGLAITATNVTRVVFAQYFLKMQPYELSYWRPIAAAAVTFLALTVWGPDRQGEVGLLSLMVTGTAGLILYGLTLFSLGLEESDRYVLAKIRQLLGGAKY